MILRLDDFPTGVRPILPNLQPIYDLLLAIDLLGVPYYLGVVPALLYLAATPQLRKLKNAIPCVHGFDHCYFRYNSLLRDDPRNRCTVGVFDEFAGQPTDMILSKLLYGQRVIRQWFGKTADTYIPPCNLGSENCAKALVAARFKRYFSENPIQGCPLPMIRSTFYGKLSELSAAGRHDVVTLHLTWECDDIIDYGWEPYLRQLDKLRDLHHSN